ncbi:22.7 kDa class IV heat shock protein [Citrus clementina]|uniref:22.7 kDa class IV heat shock protein n=1 Tax=Citrus clementina TaxID=85681 RepID=UPI000CECFABA|nr:22.7 kDa class IV heat shock protein [Citrus x clementina]
MAKPRILAMTMLFLVTATTLMNMASQANALMPYTQSPFFDMMFPMTEEPFRVLEQTPLTIAKGADHHQTLALARVDWMETPTAHVIMLDIPGMKKDNVKIEVEESRVLRVSGERKSNDYYKEGEGVEREKWHRAERTFGKFWRQFRMHMSADLGHIKAHMVNGILRVTVPKLAEEKKRQPKVINIHEESGNSSDEDIKATKAQM